MHEPIIKKQNLLEPAFKQSKVDEFRNYVIVVLMLLYETSPFFLTLKKQYLWFFLFFFLIFFNRKQKILPEKIIMVLILIWGLIIIQAILYGKLSLAAIYWPLMFIYTPFLVFTLMGLKYFKYLFNIIYFIAVYTSIIYLLQTLSPQFNEWLLKIFDFVFPHSWASWPNTILIYSAPRESGYFFMRNSGIFYEPGIYSIYLMLGIIINTFYTNTPLNRKNILLLIVLVTTFSTTGYFMLFVFLIYVVIRLKIHFILKPIIILPFALLIFLAYQRSSFLEQKVNEHFETQTNLVEQGEIGKRGRFYSFGMAIKSFSSNPIAGRGILSLSQIEQESIFVGGYGLAGLFSRFGLFFSLFYSWSFYKGFSVMGKLYLKSTLFAIMAFIILNLGLLTQAFFFTTPFIYFFLIGLLTMVPKINVIGDKSDNNFYLNTWKRD